MISRIPARMDEHEAFTNLDRGLQDGRGRLPPTRLYALGRRPCLHVAANKAKMWILAAQQFATLRDKCTQVALAKIAS
jgi:hypothetical protein